MCGVSVWCICVVYLCGVSVWCICVVYLCGVSVWCICVVYLCGVSVWLVLLPLIVPVLMSLLCSSQVHCWSLHDPVHHPALPIC